MKRQALFIIIEVGVFLAAEGANAVAIAPIPLSARIAAGSAIAAFFAFGFFVPRAPRARTVVLFLDALFLGLMATFTGIAVTVAVLLPLRCLELKPRDRSALVTSAGFGLFALALSSVTGAFVEHRPAAVLAAPILIPLYALILSLVTLSEDLRRSRADLVATNAELALRAERWQRIATLNERYQVGLDLRDEVRPGLRAIGNELGRALSEAQADAQTAKALTLHAQRTAAFTLAGLDLTVARLREESLEKGDLAASLREMCKAFAIPGAPQMTAEIANVPVRDPEAAAGLERIAREALINVARHSEAHHVKVSFRIGDLHLELLVEDDGVGFEPDNVRIGSGLTIMRDRTALIGGKIAIESTPSHGTIVWVKLPLLAV